MRTIVGVPDTGVSYVEQGERGIGGGTPVLLAIMILAVLLAFGVFG